MTVQSIEAELKRTARYQAEASDPAASVWVSANAGTGKTHVLATRVLRLMLAGTPPERILCLTYTKAAAAEMSKRVFDELAKWVMAPDKELAATLESLTGHKPSPEVTARARTLFTAATETPGGLKVQTIHAFAERLLQRFPLEAGVTPGFAILDDEMARTLRREAIDAVLGIAARDRKERAGEGARSGHRLRGRRPLRRYPRRCPQLPKLARRRRALRDRDARGIACGRSPLQAPLRRARGRNARVDRG